MRGSFRPVGIVLLMAVAFSACGGGSETVPAPAGPAKTWGTAALIEDNNAGSAQNPGVAIAPDGRAVVLWDMYDSSLGRSVVLANSYAPGTGWDCAVTLAEADTGDDSAPRIVMDGSGNAIAVWQRYDGIRANIRAIRYAAGAHWDCAATLIQKETGEDGRNPVIAMNGGGTAVAAWQQSDGSVSTIHAIRYAPGANWDCAVLVQTDTSGDGMNPQVAVGGNGTAVVLWDQYDSGTLSFNIWAARCLPNGSWDCAVIVREGTSSDSKRRVVVDGDGNAIAVWSQEAVPGQGLHVWASRYTAGGRWDCNATLVETGTGGDGDNPRIAMDGNGNAIAVWSHSDGAETTIWSSRYVRGQGWGTPVKIQDAGPGNGFNPQISVNGDGTATAVWQQAEASGRHIGSNRYVPGAGWGTAILIEDSGLSGWNPDVAVDADGNAIAVWYQWDGVSQFDIWANRFR